MGSFLGFMYLLVHIPIILSPAGAKDWKRFISQSDDPHQKKEGYLLTWSCAALVWMALEAFFLFPTIRRFYGLLALWLPVSLFLLKAYVLVELTRVKRDVT